MIFILIAFDFNGRRRIYSKIKFSFVLNIIYSGAESQKAENQLCTFLLKNYRFQIGWVYIETSA